MSKDKNKAVAAKRAVRAEQQQQKAADSQPLAKLKQFFYVNYGPFSGF